MPAFFSWKPRACQLEEDRRKKTKLEKQRVERREKGKSGKKKSEKRMWKKFESTKWFYLQASGWCGKTRRCIGIRSGESQQHFTVLLFIVVFMCECAVVVTRMLAIPPVSRFSRFKSTLSSAQLPSPLSLILCFLSSKVVWEREGRGGLWRKLIHILS